MREKIDEQTGEKVGRKKGITFISDVWNGYNFTAKWQGLKFTLTVADIEEICQLPCFFCEKEPYKIVISNKTLNTIKVNKLARFDKNKGFIYKNVVPCCDYHTKHPPKQQNDQNGDQNGNQNRD